MRGLLRALVAVSAIAGISLAAPVAAEKAKQHQVAIHVDQNDPDVMKLALNNAVNLMEYYANKGEDVKVEVVTDGPGLHMLRADTSPVKDRIKEMAEQTFRGKIVFAACDNTKRNMEKSEGKTIAILPQATIVPSGVVRLVDLQEEGWSYLRP